jgi:hypothetical protein
MLGSSQMKGVNPKSPFYIAVKQESRARRHSRPAWLHYM